MVADGHVVICSRRNVTSGVERRQGCRPCVWNACENVVTTLQNISSLKIRNYVICHLHGHTIRSSLDRPIAIQVSDVDIWKKTPIPSSVGLHVAMAIQASPMHPAGVRKQLCSVVQRLSSMVMLALGAAVVVVDVVGIVVA